MRIGGFAIVSVALFWGATAGANGRFPSANQLVLDPSNSANLYERATYGILATRDNGGHWGWICEQAVGFKGTYDPPVAVAADGTLIVGTFKGLKYSTDGGCGYQAVEAIGQKSVSDVSVEVNDRSHAIAVVSNSLTSDAGTSADAGTSSYVTEVWRSVDSGKTWSLPGPPLPDDFLAITLDAAPSAPDTIYVSGYDAVDAGVIEVTEDGGKTWTRHPIPGTSKLQSPFISAIDPNQPGTVYVRIDFDPSVDVRDEIVVTHDHGLTWNSVFRGTGDLLGFALAPDGKSLLTGGPKDGLYRVTTDTFEATRVSEIATACLTWTSDALYACGSEFGDHFTIGVSHDEGVTFTPLGHLSSLCGPLSCGDGTSVATACPEVWPALRDLLVATCEEPKSEDPGDPGGCGCRASSTASGASAALCALLMAGLLRRRVRR